MKFIFLLKSQIFLNDSRPGLLLIFSVEEDSHELTVAVLTPISDANLTMDISQQILTKCIFQAQFPLQNTS